MSALATGLRTPERSALVHLSTICCWRWRNEVPDATEQTGAGPEVARAQAEGMTAGERRILRTEWRAYGRNHNGPTGKGNLHAQPRERKRERWERSEVNRRMGTGTRVAGERRGRTDGRQAKRETLSGKYYGRFGDKNRTSSSRRAYDLIWYGMGQDRMGWGRGYLGRQEEGKPSRWSRNRDFPDPRPLRASPSLCPSNPFLSHPSIDIPTMCKCWRPGVIQPPSTPSPVHPGTIRGVLS